MFQSRFTTPYCHFHYMNTPMLTHVDPCLPRFTTPHHKEGFELFLDTITAMDDVWLVTSWQVIIIVISITVIISIFISNTSIIINNTRIIVIIRRSSGCEIPPPNRSSSPSSLSTATIRPDPRDVQVQR